MALKAELHCTTLNATIERSTPNSVWEKRKKKTKDKKKNREKGD